MAFKKVLTERALGAEWSHHLGYRAGGAKPAGGINQCNGAIAKTVLTDNGPVHIDVLRDQDGGSSYFSSPSMSVVLGSTPLSFLLPTRPGWP